MWEVAGALGRQLAESMDVLPREWEYDSKATTVHESMRYSLMAGGKRIRPIITIAAWSRCSRLRCLARVSPPLPRPRLALGVGRAAQSACPCRHVLALTNVYLIGTCRIIAGCGRGGTGEQRDVGGHGGEY